MTWTWIQRLRKSDRLPADRSTSFSWLTYRAEHGGQLLRIFNTTDKPVDQELVVKGKPFRLVDVGTQDKGFKPGPGDYIFRELTTEERNEVAELKLKGLRKEYAQRGLVMQRTEKVRATLRANLAGVLIVVELTPTLKKA